MPGSRSPGKFLQFPGAEVQPPGVGRFLQRALQPPVQGQVEAPTAATAASPNPAVGSGSSVVLIVVVVGGMMVWVKSSHREGRDERLGFASQRRHLLPPPQPRPAVPAEGSQLFPGRGSRHLGPIPCSAPPRDAGRRGGGCGRRAERGGGRRGGSSSSVSRVSCPREAKDCGCGGKQRACVSTRCCSLL